MKKKPIIIILLAAVWLGGLWYCKTQTMSDIDIQQVLNDTLLLDHSELQPDTTLIVSRRNGMAVDTVIIHKHQHHGQ
jgi:hypothetical protein